MDDNTGLIIQARTGSSRLPAKIVLPFFKGKTILDIMIENLIQEFPERQIVLATTNNPKDAVLESYADKYGIRFFRGDEQNVLKRFVDAANKFNFLKIVRICSDNPFLNTHFIKELLDNYEDNVDYVSYAFKGNVPVIQTHIGLFAELTTRKTLEKVMSLTNDPKYTEHVTNYIYTHNNKFNLKYISLPSFLEERKDIRLTIDTMKDFEISQKVYERWFCKGGNEERLEDGETKVKQLMKVIYETPEALDVMKKQIKANEKK